MQQVVQTWMETLTHLYAVAAEAQAERRNNAAEQAGARDYSCGGEAFIDPSKATLKGYLASHLNFAGEQVDLFHNESGRVCLITHHLDGSMTIDGEPYAVGSTEESPEQGPSTDRRFDA